MFADSRIKCIHSFTDLLWQWWCPSHGLCYLHVFESSQEKPIPLCTYHSKAIIKREAIKCEMQKSGEEASQEKKYPIHIHSVCDECKHKYFFTKWQPFIKSRVAITKKEHTTRLNYDSFFHSSSHRVRECNAVLKLFVKSVIHNTSTCFLSLLPLWIDFLFQPNSIQ